MQLDLLCQPHARSGPADYLSVQDPADRLRKLSATETREKSSVSPFYSWGIKAQRLNDLPKVIQGAHSRARNKQ